MMNDTDTTISQLKTVIEQFAAERDWEQFHTPKNLAMSIAIESAEILEHFQWIPSDRSERNELTPEKIHGIGEECADVLAYLLGLTNRLEIDLTAAFLDKMKRNAEKYPADAIRGRYGHDDPAIQDKHKK